jgi:hypothetical protein
LKEFESAVQDTSRELERIGNDRAKLALEIRVLEKRVETLRRKAETGSNVIDEIRLKGLLNDLKEKLLRSSSLEHRWETQRGELEQKGLSLVALYHSRIEETIRASGGDPAGSGSQLAAMEEMAQKRAAVQGLLAKYPKRSDPEGVPSLVALETLKKNDPVSLQMTLDLLNDRKRELTDRLEKLSLEEEEVRSELKLQARMRDFLGDLRRQNQDSGLSGSSWKGEGLEGMTGKAQRTRLTKRLEEIQDRIARVKETLEQITVLTLKVRSQLDGLKGGGR